MPGRDEALTDIWQRRSNTWQGRFPWENLETDRYEGTSPVGAFSPNGYGLYDATGNVWEWTSDYFSPRHQDESAKSCCVPKNPRVDTPSGRLGRTSRAG